MVKTEELENAGITNSMIGRFDQEVIDKYFNDRAKSQLKAHILRETNKARIDENESLLSVAEHEISLPDHCDMHSTFTSQCHACKKRKWYGEISKDWKRVIDERLRELSQSEKEDV